MGDEVRPGFADTHMYLSTACFHALERVKLTADHQPTEELDHAKFDAALHQRCKQRCKFCDTPCICECHEDSDPK